MADRLSAKTRVTLNDGNSIPLLGLGVFSAMGAACERAVEAALQAGYRHIDTAADYGNETSVGNAISASGIPRSDVFITTKLWPGPDVRTVRDQVQGSLEKLRTDSVDLLLIHWPIGCYRKAWSVLLDLRAEGMCRSIGVSNYTIRRFEEDFPPGQVVPSVNQIELHVFNQQQELVRYCAGRGIALAAYSPLARAERMAHPVLRKVAAKVGRSPAQVMIRFLLQRGMVAIPKSATPVRIRENIAVFDFSLGSDEIKMLETLNDEIYFSLRWRPAGYY
jgi:2,5-diketo-D-gluconate reductase A